MPVTVAICEDEKNLRDEMIRLVRTHHGEDCRADCYDSGDALIRSGKRYNIYVLDIQMPGISGLELSRQIRRVIDNPSPVIIFTTALKEHMQDAFDVQAYHFLIKPIDENKFISVLSGAVKEFRKKSERDRIVIKSGGISRVVAYSDILYAESHNKKVAIQTKNDRIEYYGKIGEDQGIPAFYRCHRCYAVNMDHIVSYDSSSIRLSNGETIPLAEKKYSEFVKAFMKHSMK